MILHWKMDTKTNKSNKTGSDNERKRSSSELGVVQIMKKYNLPLLFVALIVTLLSSCGRDGNESKTKSRPVVIWQSQIEAALKSGPEDPMALFACAQMGNLARAEELIAAGADPNKPTFFGHCPLHEAAGSNRLDIVRLLLENGAKVDVRVSPDERDSNQWTSLLFAVYDGSPDIVSVLLASGADVNVIDSYGHRPIYYARDRERYYARFQRDDLVQRFQEVAKILLEHGAKE